MYHERVVDHYDNPRNIGTFNKNDPNVGTGLVGAPACGDVMKLKIRVDEESGKIVDAFSKTFVYGSAIASSVGMLLALNSWSSNCSILAVKLAFCLLIFFNENCDRFFFKISAWFCGLLLLNYIYGIIFPGVLGSKDCVLISLIYDVELKYYRKS
ncbi:iron-sulfur cluster assembly protein 1 [Phtheirospermum japonicum]|uniref:Iron-sulfur cluster assembly protein 1 n=1 Tax=Phtheirospermum japonicum TaxID=374723 RepID=A0A830CC65_9LAMI|nr:iron-sulfur cluster assembly protein 1 [Phtheirospermum japonicum]